MRRTSLSSPFSYCNCTSQNEYTHARYPEMSTDDEDEYSECQFPKKYSSCNYNNLKNRHHIIDDQTQRTITSLRQKACRFINSDTDCTSAIESVLPDQCQKENYDINSNFMMKAKNLNYNPESTFLKKIKEKYQQQNQMQNVMTACNEGNDSLPFVCEKCLTKSKQIIKLGEQLNQMRSEDSKACCENCRCTLQTQANSRRNDTSMNDCNVAQNMFQFRSNKEFYSQHCENDKDYEESDNEAKPKQVSKAKHKSRSKKRSRCRGQKKQKSGSSEKCESQEHFEPTLKKPHEDSCERCWRYASPARSPVNKPGQRFDPNFRKAHSCTEIISHEKGEGNIKRHVVCKDLPKEEPGDHRTSVSQPIQLTQLTQFTQLKQTSQPAQCPQPSFSQNASHTIHQSLPPQSPQQLDWYSRQQCVSTRVKELGYDYLKNRLPDKEFQRAEISDCRRTHSPKSNGIIYSSQDRKPRPKCYAPGTSCRDVENFSDFLNNLNETEYPEIQVKPMHITLEDSNSSNSSSKCQKMSTKKQKDTFRASQQSRSRVNTPVNKEQSSSNARDRSTSSKRSRRSSTRSDATPTPAKVKAPSGRPSTAAEGRGCKSSRSPKSQKSRSPRGNRPALSKHSPRAQTPENLCPSRVQSSSFIQDRRPCYQEPRPYFREQATPPFNTTYTKEYSGPSLISQPHPIKECRCQPPTHRSKPREVEPRKKIYCCHCGEEESTRNPTHSFSVRDPTFLQSGQPPTLENTCSFPFEFSNRAVTSSYHPDYSGFEIGGPLGYRDEDSYCSPHRTERVNFFTEKGMECPYHQSSDDKFPLRRHNCRDNLRRLSEEEIEGYPRTSQRSSQRGHQSNSPNFFPKKYCVFYMTKGKEGEGNEVEVLVEELTQRKSNAKDSKTKNLTDKMRRVMECQGDSMALRFQKGVSDSINNHSSSRVLYF